MSKVHYAIVDRANESDNQDYWGPTLCGLEETESPMSDKINDVTCKHCFKKYTQYKKEFDEYFKKESRGYP